mgnify:CR=1 FL=1
MTIFNRKRLKTENSISMRRQEAIFFFQRKDKRIVQKLESRVQLGYLKNGTNYEMKKNYFYFFFQTCDELGFTVSDKEWVQIRNMLENSTENLDSEMMVKSEDFFSALHTIMTNKQKNRNGISEAGSNLKVSFAIDEKFFIGF